MPIREGENQTDMATPVDDLADRPGENAQATAAFGSSRSNHCRPDGATDGAVQAAGKVSEALETVERARGHLYAFHQLTGRADLLLDEALAQLHELGRAELAERISGELIGRNVLPGRWSFQVVEDYDDGYYRCFQELERLMRVRLTGGRRHVYEAEMKERRRTHGHPAHTAVPRRGE